MAQQSERTRDDDLASQANVFARYLVGKPASDQTCTLYVQAAARAGKPIPADARALRFIGRHRWSVGAVDAGLALLRPNSEVRRRLYVMLAILEASPDYADSFLPQPRTVFYGIYIIYSGLRACLKALLGMLLLKVVI